MVCTLSLLAVRPEETKGPSKRTYANMCLPGLLLPWPLSPVQANANPHVHRGPTDSQAGLAQSLVGHVSFSLGPCAHKVLFVPSKYLCFTVLWKLFNQILLSFKVRFSGDPQSLCQVRRLGSRMWGLEQSWQCETFLGIIVLRFVGFPPSKYEIWF